jgi:hypothetical protein
MGEWQEDETFKEMGFAFPVVMCGKQAPEMSAFCGYGFFRSAWGTPELPVAAMLGLAYLFQEFNIKAIHGTRFEDNTLTAKFVEQFGFKQVGRIPDYQLKDGKLVPAIVSTLLREDFERYVEEFLVSYFKQPEVFDLKHSQMDTSIDFEPLPVTVAAESKPVEPVQQSLSWL